MTELVFAALLSTLTFEGEVPVDDDGDYFVIEFEVPEGTVEMRVAHSDLSDRNILDWGVWSPEGFRGWGGGLTDDAVIGEAESSRGYLPGPITPGTWQVVVGKAKIVETPARYEITITFHDEASLAEQPRAPHGDAALAPGPAWFAGDFHVHSRESGDATATFAEIRTLALERGLDFVVLSDHNTVSQHGLMAAFQDDAGDLLFVRGVEVTTYGGHGNALGLSDYVDHRIGFDGLGPDRMIEAIAEQGALFSINHPTLDLGNACIGCAWSHDIDWSAVDAVEIHTGPYDLVGTFTKQALALWDQQLDAGHHLTALGGSDDHRAGIDLAGTQSPIGSPTTVVYAEDLSEAAVLEAVRAGRAVVKLRGPDEPMIELFIEGPGDQREMIGGSVTGHRVTVEALVTGGIGHQVMLVRNGEPGEVAEIDADPFTVRWSFDTAEAGDRYRAHVIDGSLDLTISSHVYAAYEPPPPGGCGCTGSGTGAGGGAALLLLLVAAQLRPWGRPRR